MNTTVQYRSFLRDAKDWGAKYALYTLSDVRIRERWSAEPEKPEAGETVLYFFPGRSICRDAKGRIAPLPSPGDGDLVCLRPGQADERILRVRAAADCRAGGAADHLRLTLE